MSRMQGRYVTADPERGPWGICDRCGFLRYLSDLVWQFDWSGTQLFNRRVLVCQDRCLDKPQEQFRTIILPPDPPPILNARPPNYTVEE
jgi:hypothetical protein